MNENKNVMSSKGMSASERKAKIRQRYKGRNMENVHIIPANPTVGIFDETEVKRVAVYARVSTDDPNQTSSYELQKNYYEDLVSKHPNWILVSIYADEGISGTSLNYRDDFIRLMEDCRAGKIDLLLTKSVSRFARNVEDCIHYSRELKNLKPPVGILFETENIYTLDNNSEMQLSFLATLAQEESHIKSEGMNRSIEMRFERGIFLTPVSLGFDHDEDGNLIKNESEGRTLRLMYYMCLAGYSSDDIAECLIKLGRRTKFGNAEWTANTVNRVLRNEKNCGDIRARKTFTPNYLNHRAVKNRGERAQYYEENHHAGHVSRAVYIAVQRILDQAKYRFRTIAPELRVIREGVLKGFVQINPCWMGYTGDDYLKASHSVLEDSDYLNPSIVIQKRRGDMDLRRYQVTRSQFVPASRKISVSLSAEAIKFSYDAVKEFGETMYVELLYHPLLELLVVRKSGNKNSHAIKWATNAKNRVVSRKVQGRGFVPILYDLCGWDEANGYTITGCTKERNGEKILMFYMNEPEVRKWVDGKQVITYPLEWKEKFGDFYYTHLAKAVSVFYGKEDWQLGAASEVAVLPDFEMNPDELVRMELEQVLEEIRKEREAESEVETDRKDEETDGAEQYVAAAENTTE